MLTYTLDYYKDNMATLNPEPADPADRRAHHLPPKSYADAAEEGLNGHGHGMIDEDSIKETPPRSHARQGSEPRPLGEMLDEGEEQLVHPTTPILRSSRSRRHLPDSKSWADAAVEHTNGSHRSAESHGAEVEHYSGQGMDESPRSPTIRKTQKRHSSRGTNGFKEVKEFKEFKDVKDVKDDKDDKEDKNDKDVKDDKEDKKVKDVKDVKEVKDDKDVKDDNHDKNDKTDMYVEDDGKAKEFKEIKEDKEIDNEGGGQNKLVLEQYESRGGHHLTSIQPSEDYDAALILSTKKEDRPKHTRSPSQLVSGRQAGAGWENSAIHWAPMNLPVKRRLQTFMVLAHTLSIACFLAVFFMLCAIPLLWPILLPYLVYVLFSKAGTDGTLYHRNERLRRLPFWSLFASYFPARLHRSQPLPATRKYIFGYHPHGIISHGAFAAFATEALGFAQLFPGITNTLLTLDSNFRVPLYRDYALRLGLASVSRESCENLLSKGGPNGEGMGRAITIVVGGARESLDAQPHSLRLVLARRKGFVKMAIRSGADLVPTLAFGENELYEQFNPSAHPWIHKAQLLVKQVMGFTVPLFHARGVFNYDVGMMPYRQPLNIVVGRPIMVKHQAKPEPDYVDEIHAKYVKELVRVWDEWKDVFAKERRSELEIVE